jgi:coiled-coil domain-containing protein 130
VRFNAEKKSIGKYHSTAVYSFRMLSTCCATAIEIHTDPKVGRHIVYG